MKKVDKYALLPFDDYQRLLKSHQTSGSGIIAAKTLYHSNEAGLTEVPPPLNKHATSQSAPPNVSSSSNSSSGSSTSKQAPLAAKSKASADSVKGDWGHHWESLYFAK